MVGTSCRVDNRRRSSKPTIMRLASSLMFATVIATTAQPRMSAPVVGYVFDGNARTIRAVVGVPGAAAAGDQLSLDSSLSNAFLHPSQPIAVGIGKDGGVFALSWRTIGRPQQTAIATQFGTPDRIVFASSADRALLVSAAGVELWSGLRSGAPVSVYGYGTDALGGISRKAAVSPDGTLAAIVLDGDEIIELSSDGIRTIGPGRSAIYSPDLFILSADGTLRNSANTVATGLDPESELWAVGGFNGAVTLSGQQIALVDSVTGRLTRVDCGGCKPAHAQALATNGILYFEDAARGAFLLEISSDAARIVPVAGIDARGNDARGNE